MHFIAWILDIKWKEADLPIMKHFIHPHIYDQTLFLISFERQNQSMVYYRPPKWPTSGSLICVNMTQLTQFFVFIFESYLNDKTNKLVWCVKDALNN